MCRFIDEMEKLKSSSSSSVANEKFSAFNGYMHIFSKMDERLSDVIRKAAGYKKSLVLVCGNSGDGKSHLIASLIDEQIIDQSRFDIYIDATSSDKKGMKANVKLREKLEPFTDTNILDGSEYRMIVAINLGVLNDFMKNYEDEFCVIQNYINQQGLFDNIPAWKFIEMQKQRDHIDQYFIGHVDFTSFHRYELNASGLELSFIHGLLEKIIADDSANSMYQAFQQECAGCPKRVSCPVYWNYSAFIKDSRIRDYVITILAKAIIKNNLSPSVRDINNFFYEVIIGNTFSSSMTDVRSVERQAHFIHNLTLWLLFESSDGLLAYTAKEDPLNDPERSCDGQIISLNLKRDLKKWLTEEAVPGNDLFKQIYSNIIFCESKFAKVYRDNERNIKRDIYKYYIRYCQMEHPVKDDRFSGFLKILYEYNRGNEKACAKLISLIKDCVYLWNDRLGDKSGGIIKNGVIFAKGTDKYFLYKNIEVQFIRNPKIKLICDEEEFPNFTTTMRFNFALDKRSKKIITLDIDYELYAFLLEVKRGYTPTDSDRKANVKYDSFVRNLIAGSDSDLYVYAKSGKGDTYKISCDEFDRYVFEREG